MQYRWPQVSRAGLVALLLAALVAMPQAVPEVSKFPGITSFGAFATSTPDTTTRCSAEW